MKRDESENCDQLSAADLWKAEIERMLDQATEYQIRIVHRILKDMIGCRDL